MFINLSARAWILPLSLIVSVNSVILVVPANTRDLPCPLSEYFNKWVMDARVTSSHPSSELLSIKGEKYDLSTSNWSSGNLALIFKSVRIISTPHDSYCETTLKSLFNFSIAKAMLIICSYVWFSKKSRLLRGDGFLSLNLFKSLFWIILNWTVRYSSCFLIF